MPKRSKFDRNYPREALLGLKELWPIVLLIGVIIVSIYGGFATPTEAASVACFLSILLQRCRISKANMEGPAQFP
jgi:TRAP-type C4-dicarboxylate transport system permease large subunit